MKVIIFGASGKTGRLILEKSLSKGYEVTAFTRRVSNITTHSNLSIAEGDVLD